MAVYSLVNMKNCCGCLLTFCLITIISTGHAQSYDLSTRRSGVVILNQGSTLDGEVIFGSSWNSIYFITDHGMQQIKAEAIEQIIIHEESIVSYRTLAHERDGKYYLFRVLEAGTVSLLKYAGDAFEQDQTFFTSIHTEGIATTLDDRIPFNAFGRYRKEMRDYAFSHALETNVESDLILIFSYFNDHFDEI